MDKMVEEILANFANSPKDLIRIGVLTADHLESINRNKLNETHSLIWGALSHSVYLAIGMKCVVAINRSLKSESMKRRFTPDISLWSHRRNSKLVGIVDYESTNSSDSRIIQRNFENYRRYVQTSSNSNIPQFWIIITTLPSKKVSKTNWYSWDLRHKEISGDEYLKLLENPFEYWFTKFSEGYSQLGDQLEKCPLYVANLDFTDLRLCLPKDGAFSVHLGV
jgi:hypothetical protein